MTKAKTKTKKIILLVVATLLALLILLGCVILWVPGFWHPIDFFPQYQGILDSPITKMVLRDGGYWVTVTDEDIIDRWEESLQQLQLQKIQTDLNYFIPFRHGCDSEVVVQTEEETYSIHFFDSQQISMGPFYFTPNDWNYFPFEETYDLAVERHGLDDPG